MNVQFRWTWRTATMAALLGVGSSLGTAATACAVDSNIGTVSTMFAASRVVVSSVDRVTRPGTGSAPAE